MHSKRVKYLWNSCITLLFLCCCFHSIHALASETVLVAGTRHVPPFSIKTESGWEGISVDLMKDMADSAGLKIQFREMSLHEMLENVRNRQIDAVAAALTITRDREEYMDFTHPYFSSGLGVAVHKNANKTFLSFIRGISSTAFLKSIAALLGILTVVGLLVWFVERRNNSQFSGSPIKGIGSGIWWSAVTMTTVGYGDKAPSTAAGRIIGLVWMFASIIMISGFTAAIATSFTMHHLDKPIANADDLYGKRVLTLPDSTSERFLQDKLIRYETASTVTEALSRVANEEADAVVYDIPVLRHYVNQQFSSQLLVLDKSFQRQDYGIAMPQDSEYREKFNLEVLGIIQEDDWLKVINSYLGSPEQGG